METKDNIYGFLSRPLTNRQMVQMYNLNDSKISKYWEREADELIEDACTSLSKYEIKTIEEISIKTCYL